jgi:hypothetical protein
VKTGKCQNEINSLSHSIRKLTAQKAHDRVLYVSNRQTIKVEKKIHYIYLYIFKAHTREGESE